MKATVEVREAEAGELESCFAVRRRVFVEGQGVSESLEIDGLDAECDQFVASASGEIVGTARLRIVAGKAKAERVAVLDSHQGSGLGRLLMEAVEARAQEQGHSLMVLNAQVRVRPFYEGLGYTAIGEVFREAGIDHIAMQKLLRR